MAIRKETIKRQANEPVVQAIFVTMNRMTNRPKEISFVAPLQSVQISDYRRNSLWSSFRYSVPAAPEPIRLNVHRIWRQELDALVGAFGVLAG